MLAARFFSIVRRIGQRSCPKSLHVRPVNGLNFANWAVFLFEWTDGSIDPSSLFGFIREIDPIGRKLGPRRHAVLSVSGHGSRAK